MVDRQDIDALLISALYGELTPADEARLSTHLESHPADKSALAALTRTRATVLESRFLTVQLEPPQAVSAMLLQEASARRKVVVATEPVAKEGWFSRFVGSFARHPAMAAAAMMVVVLGFAGTMYVRSGSKDASLEQSTSTFGGQGAPAAAPPPAIADEAKQLQSAAGSGYQAQLAEHGTSDDYKASDKLEGEKKEDAKKDSVAEATTIPRREAPKVAATPPRTYINTGSSKNQPMDLDEAPRENKPDTATGSIPDKARFNRTPNGVIVVDGRAPVSDPAAGPGNGRPPVAPAPRPQTVKGAGAGGDEQRDRGGEADKNDPDAQWARDQHVRVANAVKANNCKEASSLALALSNRAPSYYQQNVENDITLKKCVTYINAARDQEAERQSRARALQKRNADEAPKRAAPPAADKSTK